MVTRELVEAELNYLGVDDLTKVYSYIKEVEQGHPQTSSLSSSAQVDPNLGHDWNRPEENEPWAYLWLGR